MGKGDTHTSRYVAVVLRLWSDEKGMLLCLSQSLKGIHLLNVVITLPQMNSMANENSITIENCGAVEATHYCFSNDVFI